MTTNAFIFMWCDLGIESIIPITQYEGFDGDDMWNILADNPRVRNPLTRILQSLMLRARVNGQRNYHIYAIDCASELDEKFWEVQWEENPLECAKLIREGGHELF